MSTTSTASPTGGGPLASGLAASSQANAKQNVTVATFFSSLVVSIVVFAVQVLLFLIIKGKLPRIYNPRSYLVSERERVAAPQRGLWRWAIAVFQTSNSEFIQKCGLDAYFFLRYLRMLLKIFIPLTILILPILLSVNAVGGRGDDFGASGIYGQANARNGTKPWNPVVGLNQLAWGNVLPTNTNRYWAHLIMALVVIVYCCYIFFDELRGYVRLRQAYLISPQHRLRASATTVLVSGIPRKWCTAQALDGLYDVFPGGIRNIWINRNFDELNDKVQLRNDLMKKLEDAQTNLIKNAKKAHIKELEKEAKKAGKRMTKSEKAAERKADDKRAATMANADQADGSPVSDNAEVGWTPSVNDDEVTGRPSGNEPEDKRPILPIPIPVVGRGVEAVETGITSLGKTVFGGLKNVGREVDNALTTTQGFQTSTEEASHFGGDAAGGSGSVHSEQDALGEKAISHHSPRSATHRSNSEDTRMDENPATATHRGGSDELHANEPRFGEKVAPQDAQHHKTDRPSTADSRKVNTVPLHGKTKYTFWRQPRNAIQVPDPFPHGYNPNDVKSIAPKKSGKKFWEFWKTEDPTETEEYPEAYNKDYDPNEGEALWKRYVKPGDRDTMRLPIFGIQWLSWLPLVGEKVDAINYCRKELARLNLEIEYDQQHPDKYPLMNSAFIQFNHQVAAHMACQAVSHHIPMQMAPRAVEISPNDVIWDNMSIKWWGRWIRTFLIIVLVVGLVIGWAIPVGFTGLLSNISAVSGTTEWLHWLANAPQEVRGVIQGVLPPILLAVLLAILPLILNVLARLQGVSTGTSAQLAVSWYYFFFLFVQVFLVVTVAASIPGLLANFSNVTNDVLGFVPNFLASNIPNASNYFFSYILLQALSTSAGVLVQLVALIGWFILAPIFDSTPRQKWQRQVNLPSITWGTFFPVYTNFACIGLIYSTVAPLILIFLLITFGLFWFVYRYQTLYITKFSHDTGGLLFPQAVNQLFVGLYVMEIALIGLFSLVNGVDLETGLPSGSPCTPQAIIMGVVLVLTIAYQVLLNNSFGPLFRYLPITLEDDAVIRDEEFARAQDKRLHLAEDEREGDDINDVLAERERMSEEKDREAEADSLELRSMERNKSSRLNPRTLAAVVPSAITRIIPGTESWGRSYRNPRSRSRDPAAADNWVHEHRDEHAIDVNAKPEELIRQHRLRNAARGPRRDVEATNPNATIAEALFAGINDEIEDLTPDERDILVRRAFQHEALRARRPVIWIPRDDLGVSDDEVERTRKLSRYISISNEHTGLDGKGRVVYRKSPPDFSELDLIVL